MSEHAERVAVACPACSPGDPTVHEVLKPGGHATVRCTECGHTHKVEQERDPEVERSVVVSQDGESFSAAVSAGPNERVDVGDEFVLDTPEAIMQVRVTAIQTADERRVEQSRFEDVATLWTRAVDNVAVNVTLHPPGGDGGREETRSLKVRVPGDYEFVVGATESLGDEEFTVEGIVVRESAPEYRHGKLDHEGDLAYAKDIRRVYARDLTTSAWSAW
jgi:uncharacterized Zn finger protein